MSVILCGWVRILKWPSVSVVPGSCRRQFLQRRAAEREEELDLSRRSRVRAAARRVRGWVIARGWHNRPVIGWMLRRIDRYLP
jgi:hypothetical protein